MRRFAVFIALATLATVSVFTGRAAVAEGNPCRNISLNSGTPQEHSVWRMEVRVDEAAYEGPSIHDRLTYNWNDEAKRSYRWTPAVMPISDGMSSRLLTISPAVIGEGVPLLKRGDIVDVYVVSQGIDYRTGRAPVILRRVCAARDEGCLGELRRKQEGRVAGVAIGGGYSVASHRRFSAALAILGCSAPKDRCRGAMAAVSH